MAEAPVAEPPVAELDKQAQTAKARAHFLRGVELYEETDYEGALIEFRRAYETIPRYQVLFNIGASRLQLQEYVGALDALNQYLQEGGEAIPVERRTEVEQEIARLRSRVSNLTITADRDGVEIRIDDRPVGTTPLAEPILVGVGRRRVIAVVDGRPIAEQIVEIAGGDALSVALELPAESESNPAAMSGGVTAVVSPPERETVSWPWIATAGLAAAVATTGVLALRAEGNLSDARDRYPGSRSDLDDKASATRSLAITTDILLGATAVMGGLALWWTLIDDEGSSPTGEPSVEAAVTPGSVLFVRRF